jgi:hypothetical protein
LPWLVIGDFNEALWQEEHLSCTPRPTNQMDAFREVLFDCNLTDLGFAGVPYTYDTTRKKATHSASKLVTRSALPVRCEYHATGILLPIAHQPMRYG